MQNEVPSKLTLGQYEMETIHDTLQHLNRNVPNFSTDVFKLRSDVWTPLMHLLFKVPPQEVLTNSQIW